MHSKGITNTDLRYLASLENIPLVLKLGGPLPTPLYFRLLFSQRKQFYCECLKQRTAATSLSHLLGQYFQIILTAAISACKAEMLFPT